MIDPEREAFIEQECARREQEVCQVLSKMTDEQRRAIPIHSVALHAEHPHNDELLDLIFFAANVTIERALIRVQKETQP